MSYSLATARYWAIGDGEWNIPWYLTDEWIKQFILDLLVMCMLSSAKSCEIWAVISWYADEKILQEAYQVQYYYMEFCWIFSTCIKQWIQILFPTSTHRVRLTSLEVMHDIYRKENKSMPIVFFSNDISGKKIMWKANLDHKSANHEKSWLWLEN